MLCSYSCSLTYTRGGRTCEAVRQPPSNTILDLTAVPLPACCVCSPCRTAFNIPTHPLPLLPSPR
jgi:hypothetical protein